MPGSLQVHRAHHHREEAPTMSNKAWQDEIRESAHKIWLAGLGALAMAEAEGSKLFANLVQEGERFESAGKVKLEELRKEASEATSQARRTAQSAWGKVEEGFDEGVARALRRVGVPTREEITALSRRVEELTAAVERLRQREVRGVPPLPEVKTPGDVTTSADVATPPAKP
jgi:poly(hydroxyalkanoate) granule-associated protein